jgi:hypothetical protein
MRTVDGLLSSMPLDDLRRRLGRTDATVLDLDGSMHRGVTQGVAALDLVRLIALRPERPADRQYLLPVMAAGGALAARWLAPGQRRRPAFNRGMIDLWCRSFRGVPMFYFRLAASRIPRHSYPGVQDTVARLAGRGPVCVVSVGLSLIVEEYVRQFAHGGRALISAYRCNRMETEVRDRREVFAGRYAEPMIATAAEKSAAGRAFLDEVGSRRPLVIGNDEGDLPLARLARRRGLAVGVHPPRRIRGEFDACLTHGDWRPLADLLV